MLNVLRDSIVFFNSPRDVAEEHVAAGARVLGGLVKSDSPVRGDELKIRFAVTDGSREIAVASRGALPDLFGDGQGVVAEGALVFNAATILAKHDETYVPREVANALKRSGHWKDNYAQRMVRSAGGAGK